MTEDDGVTKGIKAMMAFTILGTQVTLTAVVMVVMIWKEIIGNVGH